MQVEVDLGAALISRQSSAEDVALAQRIVQESPTDSSILDEVRRSDG
jgi:hypothetical protein